MSDEIEMADETVRNIEAGVPAVTIVCGVAAPGTAVLFGADGTELTLILGGTKEFWNSLLENLNGPVGSERLMLRQLIINVYRDAGYEVDEDATR